MDDKTILSDFESLGRNCEFGLLQRYAGVETLGLLRWSSVSAESLIGALNCRFEGFGTPEQSEIVIQRNEYWIKDTKLNIISHTSIRDVKADIDYVKRKQYPLLQFLQKALIESLETGGKIFVYQSGKMPRETIIALNKAVQSYGKNFLLCVRLPEEGHSAGDIEFLGDGLMIGYIDREGIPAPTWDLSTEMWMTFVRAAHERWKAATSESPVTATA